MRCFGLTGGVATGKSTVLRMLRERGAVAIDADAIAREVVRPGEPALTEIVRSFGPQILASNGTLDRQALAAVVFADPERRRRLELITHPRILSVLEARLAEARRHPEGVTIVAVPLLFEAAPDLALDGVLVVDAPERLQLARLMARDRLTEAAARQRLGAQMGAAERLSRATWIIDNGGTVEDTDGQVERWWSARAATDLAVTAPAP